MTKRKKKETQREGNRTHLRKKEGVHHSKRKDATSRQQRRKKKKEKEKWTPKENSRTEIIGRWGWYPLGSKVPSI